MKLRKRYFVFLFLLVLIDTGCVLHRYTEVYSVPGTYKKQSAQGMAVWEEHVFLLNDQGFCRIYDLKDRKVIGSFPLGSTDKNNHANCASFGIEYPERNVEYPALYVSECRKPYRCFVESITKDSSVLIQTIQFVKGKDVQKVSDWIVDRQEKKLYAVSRRKEMGDSICIIRFRLPAISENNVVFTEKDVEERFCVMFPNLLQGGTVCGDRLYLPVGLHTGNESRKDAERAIIVIDLRKRVIIRTISLQDKVVNEPEDVDFYGKHLLLFCGQTGGIYSIDIK